MGYLKFTAAVMLTCCSFLSAASADGDIFENAGNEIYKLATEYSQPVEEHKESIDSCRKEILRIATSIQPTVQAKLEEIQNNKNLSNNQKFTASEAVIANQKKLMKAVENANSELDNHLSRWIGSVAQQHLCSLDDLYKSASKEPTNAEEIAQKETVLANIAKQLSEKDFMRLARKNIDLDILEMLATLYTMRDNPKAAYAKYELIILKQKADLDEEQIQRKNALENFTGCIRYVANTALALAEIQLDRYDNADDTSVEKIALRNRTSLTTAWAIALEEATKEIPSLQELAKFFRRETANAVSKKFLENLSSTLGRVNQLRIQGMTEALKRKITDNQTKLFLTNTSFLRLDEKALTALLGDKEAIWLIQTRDSLRLHPGFGEEVFLPDQLFDSLLNLLDIDASQKKFPLPTQSEVDLFVSKNSSLFANTQVNPEILQTKVLAKLKSKFADTLPIDERAAVFALQSPHELVFQAFVEAQPETELQNIKALVTQELLPNARYTAAYNILLSKRQNETIKFIGTIQQQFFDAELDFAASGIDELSDFGRLWARYHAMRNLTGTLDAEAFKTHASELLKVNAKLFFGTDFTTSTYATAAITSVLNENFWTDPFTKGKTDDESLARLNSNKAQAQATHDLLASMPDSTAKQLAVRLLGNWVTASVGKTYDEWAESGRDALAIAYLQTQKYSSTTDEFKIWNSIKELAEAFATTTLAEKQPLTEIQQLIGKTCALDKIRAEIMNTYVQATGNIFNLDPTLGMVILSNAVSAK